MSNHRVDINKTLSEITSKKGCQEPGIPWVLPKNRLSEITQKVAQMIGTTLLVYECPTFNPGTTGLWAYEKRQSHITKAVQSHPSRLSKQTTRGILPYIAPLLWYAFHLQRTTINHSHALWFIWCANGYRNLSLIGQPVNYRLIHYRK